MIIVFVGLISTLDQDVELDVVEKNVLKNLNHCKLIRFGMKDFFGNLVKCKTNPSGKMSYIIPGLYIGDN